MEDLRTVLPVQGEQRGVWSSTDMHVFLCPASTAALYPGLSPEFHLSSAAAPKLYNRDTHSLLGHAYVLRPLHDAASLRNGKRQISHKPGVSWKCSSAGSDSSGAGVCEGLSPCLFFCISKQRSFMRWMLPRRRTSSLMHRFWKVHSK